MNEQKAQRIINKIIENYRNNAGKYSRRQYPASKKHLNRAEELGILHMIPDAYGMNTPGNTEIQLIIKAAEDKGGAVGGIVDGEGDYVSTSPSLLYRAIHEAPQVVTTPKIGDTVRVLPHDQYQYLVNGAVVSNPIVRQHNGIRRSVVIGVYDGGLDSLIEVETRSGLIQVFTENCVEIIE